MRYTKKTLCLLSGLAVVGWAQASYASSAAPQTPAEALEPEVTIVDGGEGQVEEYRLAGRLYMIKVTPKKGREYYLVDSDGDGHMDTRRNELAPNLLIPSWVLLKW